TSCSSSRISMRPAPSGMLDSDIEVPHLEGVLLDELASGLDLVTHQPREPEIGSGSVLDVHAHEDAALGIHGRRPQLRRVHLAQALEAGDLNAALREIQGSVAQLFEGKGFLLLPAETQRERRQSTQDLAKFRVGLAYAVEDQ